MVNFFLLNLVILNTIANKSVQLSYTKLSDILDGFKTRIFEDDGEPIIAFGNNKDNKKRIYCLQFIGFYESLNYNLKNGEKDEVSGSKIEFDDDISKWQYIQIDNRTFTIKTDDDKTRSNLLKFDFGFDEIKKDYGLKFSFKLDNYKWISNNPQTKFILQIELKNCPNFSLDSDSNDGDNDINDDNTNDRRRRRRILDTSLDESSDETNEYKLDIAVFRNTPFATKICNNGLNITTINVNMFETYDDDNEVKIELIYDNFNGCDLIQDPYVFVDTSGFKDGLKAWQIVLIVIGVVIGVSIGAWFVRGVIKKRRMTNYEDIDKTKVQYDQEYGTKLNSNYTEGNGVTVTQ